MVISVKKRLLYCITLLYYIIFLYAVYTCTVSSPLLVLNHPGLDSPGASILWTEPPEDGILTGKIKLVF
jgi:hypothetical protein